MKAHAREFLRNVFVAPTTRPERVVPRPLASTVHGMRCSEVVHYDFVNIGESNVAAVVDTRGEHKYVLVLEVDVSGFAYLAPAKSRTANFTAGELGRWCALFRTPRARVSDGATHFRVVFYARWQRC